MDDADPISQFFPGEEDVDLYSVLGVESTASSDDIKKAYRRAALVHHPDKHATASEDARAAASLKFQQVGFAYAVLGDDKRRAKYDATGATAEGGFGLDAGEDGWEAYFEQMFEKVTRGKLDEMKKAYQGMCFRNTPTTVQLSDKYGAQVRKRRSQMSRRLTQCMAAQSTN
jgi:DnaJ homolog subfamily C member 9